jgi:pimeloyl-ACP methyl ester carboxylesterase
MSSIFPVSSGSSGLNIAFDQVGPPEAPAVVLLHGLSSYRASYDEVLGHLQPLVRAGNLQVLNIDLRGHGDSGHADLHGYTATEYAADIIEILEALTKGPTLLVGHSLGGVVAGAVAAARPDLVKALFLEDPPYFEGDAAVRNASPVAAFFPKFVAAVRERQARNAPPADYLPLIAEMTRPEDLEAKALSCTKWDPNTMQAAIDGIVWETFDPEAPVVCPLTILQADPKMGGVFKLEDSPKVMAKNPHANIVFVEGAGHSIRTGEQKAIYLQELDRFLQQNLS